MTFARDERARLADLLEEVGPEAPTLCGTWTARELAAHLVLRERSPAAAGIAVKPLAGWTERAQRRIAGRAWLGLVRAVRTGPPWWSPLALPPLDAAANSAEFFVHHEDVRRARPGWEPRPPDARRDAVLTRIVRGMGPLLYRSARTGVRVQVVDGPTYLIRRGETPVTIVGTLDELVLHAYGRDEVARVELAGDPGAVARLRDAERHV